jgi:hypothetical protein
MKPGRMTLGTLIAEDHDGIVALEPTAVIIPLETEIAPSGMRPPGASTVPTIVQSSAAWAVVRDERPKMAKTAARPRAPGKFLMRDP